MVPGGATCANLRRALAGDKPPRYNPLPTPLDSGLRRNDESGARWHSGTLGARKHHSRTNDELRVREVLSCQSETVPGLESILSRDRL